MIKAEFALVLLFLGIAWGGLNGYQLGTRVGAFRPNDQTRADIYFAGQEEATQACKGVMNYE